MNTRGSIGGLSTNDLGSDSHNVTVKIIRLKWVLGILGQTTNSIIVYDSVKSG